MRRIIFIAYILSIVWIGAIAQDQPDTTQLTKIKVDYADRGILQKDSKNGDVQKLIGNVELRHDSMYMYCDSAVIRNNKVVAGGNVIMQDGDTLVVFAGLVNYDGNTRQVDLRDSVILTHGERRMYTHHLFYDLKKRRASFTDGGLLVDHETELTSRAGYYLVDQKIASFKGNVIVHHRDFDLKSDSLIYLGDEDQGIVRFVSFTQIVQDDAEITCYSGYYDLSESKAFFAGGANYQAPSRRAKAEKIYYDKEKKLITLVGEAVIFEKDRVVRADSIVYYEDSEDIQLIGDAHFKNEKSQISADVLFYDGKTKAVTTSGQTYIVDGTRIIQADAVDYQEDSGWAIARGHVVLRDTVQNTTIIADKALYRKADQFIKAFGSTRPLLIKANQSDSLFISADTLFSYREALADSSATQADSQRIILAYADVKVYKKDFQVVCDSLSYESRDSSFRFYHQPVIWSDTTQLFADTIYAYMSDNEISKMQLLQNGFIINSNDGQYYNQIKGRQLFADFKTGSLSRVLVKGNSESYYFVLDDEGAYIGLNKAVCSQIELEFGDKNKITSIDFYQEPKFEFVPIQDLLGSSPKLGGFSWDEDRRPTSKWDVLKPSKSKSKKNNTDESLSGKKTERSIHTVPIQKKSKKIKKE